MLTFPREWYHLVVGSTGRVFLTGVIGAMGLASSFFSSCLPLARRLLELEILVMAKLDDVAELVPSPLGTAIMLAVDWDLNIILLLTFLGGGEAWMLSGRSR